jgi:hypothetical protein
VIDLMWIKQSCPDRLSELLLTVGDEIYSQPANDVGEVYAWAG